MPGDNAQRIVKGNFAMQFVEHRQVNPNHGTGLFQEWPGSHDKIPGRYLQWPGVRVHMDGFDLATSNGGIGNTAF